MSHVHMSDETEKAEKPARSSVPLSVVVGLISALTAGGTGSVATGWQVSSTMREGQIQAREHQIRMEGQIQALRDEYRNAREADRAAFADLRAEVRSDRAARDAERRAADDRMRSLELKLERVAPAQPR